MTTNLSVLMALGFTPEAAQGLASRSAEAELERFWADPDNQPDAPRYIGVPSRSSYWLDDTDIFWSQQDIDDELNGLEGIRFTFWNEQRRVRNAEAKERSELSAHRPHDQALLGQYGVIGLYHETCSYSDDIESDQDNDVQPSAPWWLDTITSHASPLWGASGVVEDILQGKPATSFGFPEQPDPWFKQDDPALIGLPWDELRPNIRERLAALNSDDS